MEKRDKGKGEYVGRYSYENWKITEMSLQIHFSIVIGGLNRLNIQCMYGVVACGYSHQKGLYH